MNTRDGSIKFSRGFLLTAIGLLAMTAITMTKIVPSTSIAGYSVFVGIAFFFIVEAAEKTPDAESGLQFKSWKRDLKKPWVLPLVLLPILTAVATLVVGDVLFQGAFSAHVLGRTSSMLSLDKAPLLIFQVVIAAFGEEIAWRGFFLGKAARIFPFWLCAVVSSALFAAGHIAAGTAGLVFYDVATIFLDSIIYALIFKKTGNCLISTVSHILCNAAGILATLIFA